MHLDSKFLNGTIPVVTVPSGRLILTTVVWCIFAGCERHPEFSVESYQSAIASGLKQLSIARQLQECFPDTDHMIIMYSVGHGSTKREWQTVSYFAGRYELTYSTSISLSEDGRAVTAASDGGWFSMNYIDRVDGRGAWYDRKRHRGFLPSDWRKFYDGDHEISVLDPEFDGSAASDFRTYVDDMRRDRRIWQVQ